MARHLALGSAGFRRVRSLRWHDFELQLLGFMRNALGKRVQTQIEIADHQDA